MSTEAFGPWPEIMVGDALVVKRGREVRKLKTPDYQATGTLPIVDQGGELICGYTDDISAAYPYELPVIVFGDHTRTLKFIGFPFAIGADGTQCLHPKEDFDAWFFYYALTSLDLRSEGYARHFKLLKQKRIPAPRLDEQRRIAEVLRSVDEAITAERAVLSSAVRTLRVLREETFCSTAQSVQLSAVASLISGQHIAAERYNTDGLGVPYLTGPSDFPEGRIVVSKYTPEPAVMCQQGDILITVKGSGVGKAVIADASYCISRQLMALRPTGTVTSYLFEAIQSVVEGLNKEAAGPIPGITRDQILSKILPSHTCEEQEFLGGTFSDLRSAVRAAEDQLRQFRVLKSALMSDLLSGRVRVFA